MKIVEKYLCSSVGVRVLIFENVRVLLLRVRDTTMVRITGCVIDTSESSEEVNEKKRYSRASRSNTALEHHVLEDEVVCSHRVRIHRI